MSTRGLVRVEVLGLGGGIARTAIMSKGETLAYENLKITFRDFDLSDFDPEAGKIHFGVVFDVEIDGTHMEVVPTFKGGRGGEPVITPAMVPGTGGITLSPGRIDAENSTVQVQVYDPSLPAAGPGRPRGARCLDQTAHRSGLDRDSDGHDRDHCRYRAAPQGRRLDSVGGVSENPASASVFQSMDHRHRQFGQGQV